MTGFMVRHFLLIICTVFLVEGCYTSMVRVETQPPGATVHYDFDPKGTTPVEFQVSYLGKHKLTLDHPDYGRRVEMIDLKAPAYLVFPLDFMTTIMPFKVTDMHSYSFDLTQESSSGSEAQKDGTEGSKKK